jgi:hypothetical protein
MAALLMAALLMAALGTGGWRIAGAKPSTARGTSIAGGVAVAVAGVAIAGVAIAVPTAVAVAVAVAITVAITTGLAVAITITVAVAITITITVAVAITVAIAITVLGFSGDIAPFALGRGAGVGDRGEIELVVGLSLGATAEGQPDREGRSDQGRRYLGRVGRALRTDFATGEHTITSDASGHGASLHRRAWARGENPLRDASAVLIASSGSQSAEQPLDFAAPGGIRRRKP